MATVKITHPGIKGEDAKKAPKREPVPAGTYEAAIMNAAVGATKGDEPLSKIAVEFQILHGLVPGDDGVTKDESHQKRRVYQDYILEPDARYPDLNDQRRYELRQLLDATDTEIGEDGSFNPEHLQGKIVVITIKHRPLKENGAPKKDDDGNPIIFTNVVKVDTAETVSDDELV